MSRFPLLPKLSHVISVILATAFFLSALPSDYASAGQAAGTTVLYVSPSGRDTGAGTAKDPLNTFAVAMKKIRGAGTILAAPGAYPAQRIDGARTGQIVIKPSNAKKRPEVGGVVLFGASNVTFSDLDFTGPVTIYDDVFHTYGARDVTLDGVEITAPGKACVTIRNRAQKILIKNAWIHDCSQGIAAPNGQVSSKIAVRGSLLENFTADAIQFAGWKNVSITGNTIRNIVDPTGTQHNDGIQVMGNSSDIAISGNTMSRSKHQLILVQDALGPVDDVTLSDNTISGAGGYGVQLSGATRASIDHNVVADTYYGGLLVRGGNTAVPKDTDVVSNIFDRYGTYGGVSFRQDVNNRTICGRTTTPECVPSSAFEDSSSGDFALLERLTAGPRK